MKRKLRIIWWLLRNSRWLIVVEHDKSGKVLYDVKLPPGKSNVHIQTINHLKAEKEIMQEVNEILK